MKPVRLILFWTAMLLSAVAFAQQGSTVVTRVMQGDTALLLTKRGEGNKYIVAAALNKHSRLIYFINRYGQVWDSLKMQQKEADSLTRQQLDPFKLYHAKMRLAIACQDELIRQFRTHGRLDSLSPLYRSAIVNFPEFRESDSSSVIRHILTLERQNRRDSIYAWGMNADDPKFFLNNRQIDNEKAGGRYTKGDTLVFINSDKLSPVCRAVLIRGNGRIIYFSRHGTPITSFTLEPNELKADFNRMDVFSNYLSLLERAKMVLDKQMVSLERNRTNRYAVLSQQDRALAEAKGRKKIIDQKLAYAVAPDLEALEAQLNESYKNLPADHEWLSYLGIPDYSTPPSWDSVGNKRYELTNHLGNVMATISDARTNASGYYKPVIKTAQDYFAFGALMPGRNVNTENTRYGFNGKENDNEVKGIGNQQDYGMRIYDPRSARFLSVDTLSNKFPQLTPYQFASNTPLQAVDLDGKEAFYVHGTWSNPNTFSKLSISTIDAITRNKTAEMFSWSGSNISQARLKAGSDLAKFIIAHRDPKQPLTIVGHSHGGNVAIIAANILKSKGIHVNNLITFNTPSREYQLQKGAVDRHIQIYQKFDPVQGLAGNAINIPDKILIIPNRTAMPIFIPIFGGSDAGTGEIGTNISRTFNNAINIVVPFDPNNIHNTHNTPKLWEDELNRIINIEPVKLPDSTPPPQPTEEDYQQVIPPIQ